MIENSWPLIESAGPNSAFNLSLDKHHMLMELDKLAWQLLMDPIDGFIDNEEATWTEKVSARASRIKHCREQFVNAALQKTDLSSLVGTSGVNNDINGVETLGTYGGDYDIDDKGNLSYHSSDGSDKDDSIGELSFGNGAKGTSPPANARNIAGQSLLGRQNNDYWTGSKKCLITKHTEYLTCFPPQSPNASHALHARHIDADNPHGWICVFLRKSDASTWEVFDNFF
jgi:hypothetical protein